MTRIEAAERAEEIASETSQYCGETVIHIDPEGSWRAEATGNHTHNLSFQHFTPILARMDGFEGDEDSDDYADQLEIEKEEFISFVTDYLSEEEGR